MTLLAGLATADDIENEKDSVGGNGAIPSAPYLATITLAYVTKSSGGATGLVLQAKTDGGQDIKETLWMTSGTAKGCKNYYEKDGKKHYLPGFLQASSLTLLTVGKEISAMDTESKMVNVYNKESKGEVPTKVDVLVDLLGKQIIVGLIKQTVDKTAKNDAGAYVPTGETREENSIDKFFRASDKLTTSEIRAGATEAAFYDTWASKWTGVTRNKASKTAGTAGAPAAAGGATKKPATSLFAT